LSGGSPRASRPRGSPCRPATRSVLSGSRGWRSRLGGPAHKTRILACWSSDSRTLPVSRARGKILNTESASPALSEAAIVGHRDRRASEEHTRPRRDGRVVSRDAERGEGAESVGERRTGLVRASARPTRRDARLAFPRERSERARADTRKSVRHDARATVGERGAVVRVEGDRTECHARWPRWT